MRYGRSYAPSVFSPCDFVELISYKFIDEISEKQGVMTMKSDQDLHDEKRSRLRASFQTDVVVTSHNGKRIKGLLDNVSISGMYIQTEHSITVGSNCNVDIVIFGRNSSLKLSVSGSVARSDDSGIGIKFDSDLEWWTLFPIFASYLSVPKKDKKSSS